MKTKLVSIALSLLVAGAPVFAQQSSKSGASAPKSASHHKVLRGKNTHEIPAALAALPDAQRLAIQADLVWLGNFDGMSAEEVDGHTADAIKAFQRRSSGKDTGVLSDQERAALAEAAKTRQAAVAWRLIDDTATGARLGIPEKLVPRTEASRTGSRWASAHGQIQIETFRLHEASLPALFDEEKKTARRQAAYSALGSDSFVIVGEQKLKKFVERAQSSGGEIRGVTVLYDQATEGTMAPIAIAVSDTFAGFPDPNATFALGHKRGVEYGTALVVSSRGDLVAPADVTDQCRSLTVPGFGHADRIAADTANGMVLLRLYGARGLAAASLAGDSGAGSALTLFGIADPLAQAGDGKVTNAAAQLTAQGLDPAPKLGFSGAAAIDAQGRFAGIVALKAPAIAGTGPVTQQATLVPADAVLGFLKTQGITPAAGRGSIDQSVVRVICVRK